MKNKEAMDRESNGINRRSFVAKTIFAGAGLAALAASQNEVSAQTSGQRSGEKLAADPLPGRRRLGKLEVSSVGLGVQNMSRKYETTVPYRPEMSTSSAPPMIAE
jgi:hypothetical protein